MIGDDAVGLEVFRTEIVPQGVRNADDGLVASSGAIACPDDIDLTEPLRAVPQDLGNTAFPVWGSRSATDRKSTVVFSDGWTVLVSFAAAAGKSLRIA